MISIHREPLSQGQFESQFNIPAETTLTRRETLGKWRRQICTRERVKKSLLSTFPFIEIMKNYQWKEWIVSDIMAGLSVGSLQIPQAMGFSLLAELPAYYGLYAVFYSVIIYFFLGTSRHISMGTTALVSIMISSIVQRQMASAGLTDVSDDVIVNGTMTQNATDVLEFKVGVVMSVSLIMGIMMVLMSFLRLGVIATYMSMPFVRSFMTGAGINIMANQIPAYFQIRMPPMGTIFKSPRIIIEIFRNITQTNVATLLTGIICTIVLYIIKEVINEKFKHKLKVPIPAEFIAFILGTLISHFGRFNERWGVKVIGSVPQGLPAPSLPTMYNYTDYLTDGIMIAIVSFAISVSMAKLLAKKHGYSIDTNQEMFSYGVAYGVGALFQGHCGAQAPPRSVVQDVAGGKTQLASLVSSVMVLIFALAAGPLFVNLPNSVLAAIIFVALIPLMKSFTDLRGLWKTSKLDFATWLLTVSCVVFIDITVGLIAGMVFSVLSVTIQNMWVTGRTVTEVDGTGLYAMSGQHPDKSGVKIFQFHSSLYFVNIDSFKQSLFKKTLNPKLVDKLDTVVDEAEWSDVNQNNVDVTSDHEAPTTSEKVDTSRPTENCNMKPASNDTNIHTIILDCSSIAYVDIMGINLLKELGAEYKKVDVRFSLAACCPYMLRKLESSGIQKEDMDGPLMIYPSVNDAVSYNIKSLSDATYV